MRPRLARALGTEASKLEPGPVAGFGFPDDTSGVSDWVSPVGCYLPVRGRGRPVDTTCPVAQRLCVGCPADTTCPVGSPTATGPSHRYANLVMPGHPLGTVLRLVRP